MVISSVNTVTYNGDGITTAWPFTFSITDATEIKVQLIHTDGTYTAITSDYYVDVVNSTVYYPGYAPGAEPPEVQQPPKVQTGEKIEVYREVPMTQEADLGEAWPFYVIEKGLDKLTMICQQIYSGTIRTLDSAIASMFQLAGIVTDSGKLQHITDQYNAIDANAAKAAARATAAASSATAAANSAASASTTAAQLADYIATKETLTAPVVDPTLAIGGAAADAKATGKCTFDLMRNNIYNLCSDCDKTNATTQGITYTWDNAGTCVVSGTQTSSQADNNIFASNNSFPKGISPGETYYIEIPGSTHVVFEVWKYVGNTLTMISDVLDGGKTPVTIPSDSTGLLLRLHLAGNSGRVINETVKPTIHTVNGEALNNFFFNADYYGLLAGEYGYTDANNVDKNCVFMCTNGAGHEVQNVPYSVGWLATFVTNLTSGSTFRLQIMYPYDASTQDVWCRRASNSTWTDWYLINPSALQNKGVATEGLYASCDDVNSNSIYLVTKNGTDPCSIPDFPQNQAGWLQTFVNGNWLFQIAYPWGTDAGTFYRMKNSGGWQLWKQFGTGGGGITNNYITNHYSNTYNVTATPTITTDTNQYLASSGDTTDRASDIETLLSTTGVCHLGPGNFYVSGVDVPAGCTLDGCGNATKIYLLASVTDGYTVRLNTDSALKDVMLIGSGSDITLSATVGTRHGVLWEGNADGDNNSIPYKGTVSNVLIKSFTGGAITCYNTGYNAQSGLNVENVHIENCNAGINVAYFSEFSRFTNVNAVFNYYGCINNGGNNLFVNCNFSGNKMGMLMDNSLGQSPNNTHGSAVGCVFNHSDSNAGIGIKILNCPNGFSFTGCQIFFSQIYLKDTGGIVVANTNFGQANCDITVENGGSVLFSGNMHGGQPTITITNNSNVKFVDCFVRSNGAEVTP